VSLSYVTRGFGCARQAPAVHPRRDSALKERKRRGRLIGAARAVFAGWIPIMPHYLPSTPTADALISYRSRWVCRGCPLCDINATDLRLLSPSSLPLPLLSAALYTPVRARRRRVTKAPTNGRTERCCRCDRQIRFVPSRATLSSPR
jgi:hypothetical protein